MYKYFQNNGSTHHISAWKSKGLSNENINPPATSDNSLALSLNYIGTKTRVNFDFIEIRKNHIYSWKSSIIPFNTI